MAVVLAACGADPDDAVAPTTTTVPSEGGLPSLAPPLASGAGGAFTGVARSQIGASCTGTLIETGVDTAPAYFLTNGHCASGRDIGANDVDVNVADTGTATFRLFADDPSAALEIPIVGVPYSTMKGLDVTIAQLGVTLGEAKADGLRPLPFAATPPGPGAKVVNVGVPVQGVDTAEQVLRRGDCTLGDQVDLLEFIWHFDRGRANDCPGIRAGSSGSPLVGADGSIVAMINTTTAGADPMGGDCGLGKPCERRASGVASLPDRSYAVPVDGLGPCFGTDGVFSLSAARCPLDPGVVTAGGDRLSVQPQTDGAPTTITMAIDSPPASSLVAAMVNAATTECTAPDIYSDSEALGAGEISVPVAVPPAEGFYLFCVARPGDERHAAQVVMHVDATPPTRVPELSIVTLADEVRFEPIFSIPELSDYELKFGPPALTNCGDRAGYVRYRRIPVTIDPDELPARVCVAGFDDAGNRGQPLDRIVSA